LNVSPESKADTPSGNAPRLPADELLDELTGWAPRDRLRMFSAWHRGSLSIVHLTVLALLESQGPLSMSAVAEALDVSQASATGIIDRMEERGLVHRQRDDEDRRVVAIHLADAGAAVSAQLLERRREHLRQVLAELSEDEVTAFLKGIRALRAARTRQARAVGEATE
jgi:DNA-binding MarR family transcriptional regulator